MVLYWVSSTSLCINTTLDKHIPANNKNAPPVVTVSVKLKITKIMALKASAKLNRIRVV